MLFFLFFFTTNRNEQHASNDIVTQSCADSCCQQGKENAKRYGSSFYQAGDPMDGVWYGCPLGYSPNMLLCATSPKWCQPTETLNIQGVVGRAYLREGDCSPGPKINKSCRYIFGERKVYIRKPMQGGDISSGDYPYRVQEVLLVAEALSARDGYFVLTLAPGEYSLFVEDGGKEYCPNRDCNFNVTMGSTTRMDAQINKASD